MIKLSKRLDAISSLVPIKSNVIDIGCDHALLDIYLYQKKICNKIIATDVNDNALKNAKENIKKNNLTKEIEVRLGNGLNVLYDEDDINTIIIAGMGAHTIVGVLKNGLYKLNKIDTIIIQSNTKLEFLRKEITKLNYKIEDELLVLDNKKVYTVIKFVKGKTKYNKRELYFGPVLLKKKPKLFRDNALNEFAKLQMVLRMLPKDKLLDRYKLKKEIRLYHGIID